MINIQQFCYINILKRERERKYHISQSFNLFQDKSLLIHKRGSNAVVNKISWFTLSYWKL